MPKVPIPIPGSVQRDHLALNTVFTVHSYPKVKLYTCTSTVIFQKSERPHPCKLFPLKASRILIAFDRPKPHHQQCLLGTRYLQCYESHAISPERSARQTEGLWLLLQPGPTAAVALQKPPPWETIWPSGYAMLQGCMCMVLYRVQEFKDQEHAIARFVYFSNACASRLLLLTTASMIDSMLSMPSQNTCVPKCHAFFGVKCLQNGINSILWALKCIPYQRWIPKLLGSV